MNDIKNMTFSQKLEKLKQILNSKNVDVNFIEELQKLIDSGASYKELITGIPFNKKEKELTNVKALNLLEEIRNGEKDVNKLTEEEIQTLASYTGAGGTSIGSADEYYTPKYVAKAMWNLFDDLPSDTNILDPSAGVGIFGQTKPSNVKLTSIDINSTTAEINRIVTKDEVIAKPFEIASKDIEDNSLDGVITNVPFTNRDMTLDDDPYFKDVKRLEDYFILKSLQKLKYGKRAIFITPTGVVDNIQRKNIKKRILNYGSFLGGFRLPNKIFSHTGANVATDIIVFEKHPKNVIEAIKQGLIVNGGIEEYIYKNKVNAEYYNGNYFVKSGAKNVLGVYIDSKTFQESELFDGNSFGTQVLTLDSIDEIKQKLELKLMDKIENTTEYNKLTISSGINIFDDEADKIIYKNDEYAEYFKDFIDKEKVTLKDIETFAEKFKELGSFKNNQVLFRNRVFTGGVVSTLMAINYGYSNTKLDEEKSLRMYKIIEYITNLIRSGKTLTKTHLKILNQYNSEIKQLYDKKKAPSFKCGSKTISYANEYNDIIEQRLSDIRLFITSKYDVENRELISNESLRDELSLDMLKHMTFGEVIFQREISGFFYDEKNNAKCVDPNTIKKEIVLNNPEIALFNGKAYSFEDIYAKYGAKFKEAENKIKELKFSDEYGLTKKEFEDKKQSMLNTLKNYKRKPNIDKLVITKNNVDYLVPKEVMGIVEEYADSLYKEIMEKKPFQTKYNKDNTFRDLTTRYSKASLFSKSRNALIGVTDSQHEEIFNTLKKHNLLENPNMPIKEFYKFSYDPQDYSDIKRIKDEEKTFIVLSPIIKRIKSEEIREFNIKLDLFCKQNKEVSEAIKNSLDENAKIGFDDTSDTKSGKIYSLKELMSDEWVDKLHGYQNEDINKFSTTLSGVVASQTGLGKTAIASGIGLKAIQNGKAKRVLYVVPNGVYDKWKMEMTQGRKDKDGNIIVQPVMKNAEIAMFLDKKNYNKDYQKFVTNKNKKILFVTYEQFASFKFKEKTLKDLMGTSQKELEENPNLSYKPSAIPEFNPTDWGKINKVKNPLGYFEDGYFDLVIYDEAQEIKNSATGGGNFKFASALLASQKGIKSRVVSAYLNKEHNDKNSGTILVTATPFTNSPYEIYQTLRKIGGLKRVRDFKAFEHIYMSVEEESVPKVTKPDEKITVKMFKGLIGLDLLRNEGLDLISYRTAEKEAERKTNNIDKQNLKPDEAKYETVATLPENDNTREEIVTIYEKAREYAKELENGNPDDELVQFFENLNINDDKEILKLASPFSVLSKIDNLAISPEFAKGYISLNVVDVETEKLNKLVKTIEKKTITIEEWDEKIEKGELIEKKVKVKYTLSQLADKKEIEILKDGILTIPTTDNTILNSVLKELKDYNGLFDIDKYPKYKELFKNITKELSEHKNAKQIIFSLSLSGALIVENLAKDFFNNLKINPSLVLSTLNIDVKTDDEKDTSGELAKFQEKFNNSQIPTLLIFTRRTSTGVDFNNNTRAVHLLDIPYTPDVLEQAKGRAIRQGNKVKEVSLYTYTTQGTFDDIKLEILDNKKAWQNDLLENVNSDLNGVDNVAIDKEVIQEAISKYGVNFTKEQVQEIIQSKKNAQVENIKKQNEIKIEFVKNNLEKIAKNLAVLYTKNSIVGSILNEFGEDREIGYRETSKTYPDKPLSALKVLLKNIPIAVNMNVRLNIENEKISNITKMIHEEGKEKFVAEQTKLFKKRLENWEFRYFIQAYNGIMLNDNVDKKHKDLLQKTLNDSMNNAIEKYYKKIIDLMGVKERLKKTLSLFKEIATSEEDKNLANEYEDVLNMKKIIIKGSYYGYDVIDREEALFTPNITKENNPFKDYSVDEIKERKYNLMYINNFLFLIDNYYIADIVKFNENDLNQIIDEISKNNRIKTETIENIKNYQELETAYFSNDKAREKYQNIYMNSKSE